MGSRARTTSVRILAATIALSIPMLGYAAHRSLPILLMIGSEETVTLDVSLTPTGHSSHWEDVVVPVTARFVSRDGSEVGTSSQEVKVVGFGTFSVKHRKAHSGDSSELVVNETFVGFVRTDALGRLSLRVDFIVEEMGRNPRTGETVAIPPSNVPAFRVGKSVSDAAGRTLASEHWDVSLRGQEG
jgi:nucleoid DNA-binding protein